MNTTKQSERKAKSKIQLDAEKQEKLRTYRREYYRKYRNEHRELIRAINKKYVQRHRKQIAEYKRQWHKKRQEKLIAEGKLVMKKPRKLQTEVASKGTTSKKWTIQRK
jgi:hypothetical protein